MGLLIQRMLHMLMGDDVEIRRAIIETSPEIMQNLDV
jgi:DNA gyrase/topoisomerase IV subunit B